MPAPGPLPPRASSPATSSPSACPTAMRSSKPPLRCGSAARRRPRCRGGCRAARPQPCWKFSNPSLVVGGEARLECAQFAAGRFRAGRFFGRTAEQSGGALLEGDDQRRLDRTAQGDPRSSAGGDRHRRPIAAWHSAGVSLLNPGPLYHNAPFIVSHTALFAGGRVTGMVKFDAEETLRLIEANRVQWVNFVPTMMHRIWALPEQCATATTCRACRSCFTWQLRCRLAEGKMDRVAGARSGFWSSMAAPSGRAPA